MSTSDNLYGGCANIREFLVAPVTAIDTPIENNYFANIDGTYNSVTSHAVTNSNRSIKYTTDGLYFYYGIESSDLKNDTKDLKTFVKTSGLNLGTDDFTAMIGDEFWVLNLTELGIWLELSPHNVLPIEEVV